MKYKYYQDVKYTEWERFHFTVKAKSQEEADEKVRGMPEILSPSLTDYIDGWIERLDNTKEYLNIIDNMGCSTTEVYNSDDKLVIENGK